MIFNIFFGLCRCHKDIIVPPTSDQEEETPRVGPFPKLTMSRA